MNLVSLSEMTVSPEGGWREVLDRRLGIAKVFLFLVLPLSLLPPTMLYFAGKGYGDEFLAGFAAKPWGEISVVFFALELATVAGMGWLIRQVARSQGLAVDYHDAYLVAAIAPVPLWLSSLGLLVPSLAVNAALSLTALAMSCALIYHGISAVARRRHDVAVLAVVQTVMGAGLVAWALLLGFVMPVA